MEYIALLQKKTLENKEYKSEAHIISTAQSYLCLSHTMTRHVRNAVALQMMWGHFGTQHQGRALKAKPLPLLFIQTNLQLRSITLSRRYLLHTSHLKVCECYLFPFLCSQCYCWSTAFLWPSLNLGVLSAGYIQLADNFYGDRRACIPLQAQSTELSVDKSLVSCTCKLPLLLQSQLQGTATQFVHHSVQLRIAWWLQLD